MQKAKEMLTLNAEICKADRDLLKKKHGISKIWNDHYSPAKSIGKCSTLYKILKPNSYQDFLQKYLEYAERNKDTLRVIDRGLTEDELILLAQEYKFLCERQVNINEPLTTYLNDAICHIIIETYDGMRREEEAISIISSRGYRVRKGGDFLDRRYGVDLACTDGHGKCFAVQVKPVSFFLSNRIDVTEDRNLIYQKKEKLKKEKGMETFYMIYDKNVDGRITWIKNHDDNFAFAFDDALYLGENNNVLVLKGLLQKIRNK